MNNNLCQNCKIKYTIGIVCNDCLVEDMDSYIHNAEERKGLIALLYSNKKI